MMSWTGRSNAVFRKDHPDSESLAAAVDVRFAIARRPLHRPSCGTIEPGGKFCVNMVVLREYLVSASFQKEILVRRAQVAASQKPPNSHSGGHRSAYSIWAIFDSQTLLWSTCELLRCVASGRCLGPEACPCKLRPACCETQCRHRGATLERTGPVSRPPPWMYRWRSGLSAVVA